MIEQVLFTAPGERVNRPTFGCGLTQLLFAPNDTALAAAVNVTVQSSLPDCGSAPSSRVAALDVTAEDAVLTVDLTYVLLNYGAEDRCGRLPERRA